MHVCDIENADADNYNELEQVILKKDLKNFHFFKSFFMLCLSHLIERGENRMQKIIKWFVLLIYKDMQNFKMDESIDQLIHKQIINLSITEKERNTKDDIHTSS